MAELGKKEIHDEAVQIVDDFVRKWTDAEVWITEKIRFRIRDLVRTCRKNYWGVFDKPYDKVTGRKKIWQPLTEELCDSVAPKIRIPKKALGIFSKNKSGYSSAEFLRFAMVDHMDRIGFSNLQDKSEMMKVIDGTSIKKVMGKGDNTDTKLVDTLNFYIDPHAESIQSTDVAERSIMSPKDIKATDWINTDVKAEKGLHPTDEEQKRDSSSTSKGVAVYEFWGKIPERLITGIKEDTDMVEGRIVVSGIRGEGKPTVHAIRRNTNKDIYGEIVKPYVEDRYIVVPGRFYGKGIAEKLIPMQLYLNIIVNIRISRSYVSQLGIFKIRKGSNITPDQFRKLAANGAITVSSMDDIEEMAMSEASQASYLDENNIRSIAQRLTSAFEVVTGEGLTASTPATNAVIQNKNALTTFTRIQDRAGQAFKQWAQQVIPRIADGWDPHKIVTIFGDDAKFNALVDRAATAIVRDALYKAKNLPSEEALLREFNKVKKQLRNDGKFFTKNIKDVILDGLDVRIAVTNEDLDAAIAVDKLMTMLQVVPEIRVPVVKQVFDLLQLPIPEEFNQQLNQISDRIGENIDQGQLSDQILGDVQGSEIAQTIEQNTTGNTLSQ